MSTPWHRVFGYSKRKDSAEVPVIELLARVPLFEELTRRELAAVEKILHRREYLENEVIFRQGERGMGMYIVLEGKVGIVSEPGGVEISELKNGDFFGEVALLDESPRSATAVAKTACSVFGFFQPDLFGLIARNSRLGLKIVLRVARHVGRRLLQANERVLALTAELEEQKKSAHPAGS